MRTLLLQRRRRRSGPLQEPDLVETVAVGGVGVAGHDERIVDTHGGGVQELHHGADLVYDGHLVGGASEGPVQSKNCEEQSKTKQKTFKHSPHSNYKRSLHNWRSGYKCNVTPRVSAANRTRILLQNPQPCVYGRGRPDLDEDFAVGRLRRLGLVLRGKEIGHSNVMRHHRAGFVGAHHCDDGERHSQVVS